MKVKTSVTISEDVLAGINEVAELGENRSEFVERAVRALIARKRREAIDARDLEIINRNADALNNEAADVLTYQVDW